ncbi:hypothetical protein [Catellatospora sp. NPDC049609]|uniref:hypothetical protein n=1 Tax=Catellatospora sp. NPDC049609 TaxID=3155505 RepID=UPI0034490580
MSGQFDEHDQAASERLLDDAHARLDSGDPLVGLLMRAAAPGRPEELAGADAVLAAFRAAYPAPEARSRGTLRRAITLKATALVAALTVGGVAFATGTGVLPNPFPIGPQSDPDGSPSSARTPAGTSASASAVPSPSGLSLTPAPAVSLPGNLMGLCRSYLATADRDKPKATDSPEYAALLAAAAGQDLTAYCQAMVDARNQPQGGQPSTVPSPHPSRVQPSKAHASKSPKDNGAPQRVTQTPRVPER